MACDVDHTIERPLPIDFFPIFIIFKSANIPTPTKFSQAESQCWQFDSSLSGQPSNTETTFTSNRDAQYDCDRAVPLINCSGDPGEVAGRCTVNRLRLDNFEVDATTDFTEFGSEIYDLLPITEPTNWPLLRDAA